mgnify:CR=1 FL=1
MQAVINTFLASLPVSNWGLGCTKLGTGFGQCEPLSFTCSLTLYALSGQISSVLTDCRACCHLVPSRSLWTTAHHPRTAAAATAAASTCWPSPFPWLLEVSRRARRGLCLLVMSHSCRRVGLPLACARARAL